MRLEDLKKELAKASKVFVLTDEQVAGLWLPELKHALNINGAVEIVLEPGESNKDINSAMRVWDTLHRFHADRGAILVNFGGGMVTDLGGFAASTYLRGIRFVNVPTTLLAMVDASIGGKNGINLESVKNQIGTFAQPMDVLVNPVYLSTLEDRELLSGLAEMVKYGYIVDPNLLKVNTSNYEQYLLQAGRIKKEIVEQDYHEQGLRKVLNFGHTFGHAIEGFTLSKGDPLTHGESVAIGMWCAMRVSIELCGLGHGVLLDYEPKLQMLLAKAGPTFKEDDVKAILPYLDDDKKRHGGQGRFVLLKDIAQPRYDQAVPNNLVEQALVEVAGIIS